MEKNIYKEDIFIAITKSAITKMQSLFSEDVDNNTYIHNGREYGEYEVPVFIILSGFAEGASLVTIYHHCVMQMRSRGYSPDPAKLNRIIEKVKKDCQDEINLVKETERRYSMGEAPISIFNDVIKSLVNKDFD